MKNDFNYELPISWNEIPKEYNWLALNIAYDFPEGKEYMIGEIRVSYVLNGFKKMPYPLFDDEIIWVSDEQESNEYEIKFDFHDSVRIKKHILQHLDENQIDIGKSLWQRPYNSDSPSMREIAEQLWRLLDSIDSLSDIFKPTLDKPNSTMAFYNNALKYAAKRFDLLKSDGYKLYTNEEFENLPKVESKIFPLDKDLDENKRNSEN